MNDTPQSQEYIHFRNVMVWSALQMRLELVLGVTNLAKPVLQFLDKIFTGTSSSKGTYVVCVAFHALLWNNVFLVSFPVICTGRNMQTAPYTDKKNDTLQRETAELMGLLVKPSSLQSIKTMLSLLQTASIKTIRNMMASLLVLLPMLLSIHKA